MQRIWGNRVLLIVASEETLVDAEYRIQHCKHNKETLEKLVNEVDEPETKTRSSPEHVRFPEDYVSEESNHLSEKNCFSE